MTAKNTQPPVFGRLKKDVTVHFKVGTNPFSDYGDITVPTGTRMRLIQEGSTKGKYFVDDISFIDKITGMYHDAYYYGIVIDSEHVKPM